MAVVAAVGVGTALPRGQDRPPTGQSIGDPSSASVVIAEVLFDPQPGDSAFVELLNAGTEPADLSRMTLASGESEVLLVRVTDPLPAGARLLVRYDGQGRIAGATYHAPQGASLNAEHGAVELRGEDDGALDRIAWGTESGAADELEFDGTPPPGRTLGRPPGATAPQSETQWVVYEPSAATPGAENPLPRLDVLLPLDGATISGLAQLNWYRVIGAASYRVQIARDDSFASPVFDTVVTHTQANAGLLAPGPYVWRVQAIDSRGRPAAFSSPSGFEAVRPSNAAIAPGAALNLARRPANNAQPSQALPDALLPVPLIKQHKDTPMLQLENPREDDPHGWDRDHQIYDEDDPSDEANCVLASIAMVNHYLGGDLNQDRVGYEVKSRNAEKYLAMILAVPGNVGLDSYGIEGITKQLTEKKKGPEWDLNYGNGTNPAQTVAGVTFAFNPTGSGAPHLARTWRYADSELEALWTAITTEIDSNRPIIAARKDAPNSRSAHAFVVRGYGREADGRRFLVINDPITGSEQVHIERMRHSVLSQFRWFFLPENPVGRRQEPAVKFDSDGDGVVDFDETERFMTDPNDRDSDHDGVGDKEDIVSGVFDPQYGYATHTSSSRGRDFDGDDVPTERDRDSDDGGCFDGVEDENGEGHRDRPETWNFDDVDDKCRNVNGKLEVGWAFRQTNEFRAFGRQSFLVTVRLQPMAPGELGSLVDNGSRYRGRAAGQLRLYENSDCPLFTRQTAQGRGTFDQDGASIGGMLYHNDGEPEDPTPGDRIIIDAAAPVHGRGTVDSCVISGSGPLESGVSTPRCIGKPDTPSGRAFTFDCTTPPPPPPDGVFLSWFVKGRVSLEPNLSASLPLSQPFRNVRR